MSYAGFPTPFPAGSSKPDEPRPTTAEHEALLSELISYLEQPDYVLPNTLKEWKALNKSRPKPTRQASHTREGTQASTTSSFLSFASKDTRLEPLNDREKCWLSREQLLRFSRAVKWNFQAVVARVEETLVWRREFGVESLTADDVAIEGETGKQIIAGFDDHARPCYHMYPYRQNTKYSPRQIQFVVWYLERTIDLMPPDVESLCLCIDFGADLPTGGGQPTSLGAAKTVLYILQTYYGERLGRAICVSVPGLFWMFYKLVGPFVDPVTKEKIVFTRQPSEARAYVPVEQLEKSRFGGDLDFTYDHKTYFPALAKLASDRHEATFENWQKMANGKIGFSERLTRPPYEVPAGHANGVEEKLAGLQLETEPVAAQAQEQA